MLLFDCARTIYTTLPWSMVIYYIIVEEFLFYWSIAPSPPLLSHFNLQFTQTSWSFSKSTLSHKPLLSEMVSLTLQHPAFCPARTHFSVRTGSPVLWLYCLELASRVCFLWSVTSSIASCGCLCLQAVRSIILLLV